MQRIFQATILMVVLAACQDLEYIGAEQGNPLTYRTMPYKFDGSDVYFVYKLHEVEGQTAICGFLSTAYLPGPFGEELIKKWFDSAKLTVLLRDGDATTLGYGSFLMVRKPGATVFDGEARCVRSEVPWRDEFEGAVVIAEGPRTVRGRY